MWRRMGPLHKLFFYGECDHTAAGLSLACYTLYEQQVGSRDIGCKEGGCYFSFRVGVDVGCPLQEVTEIGYTGRGRCFIV